MANITSSPFRSLLSHSIPRLRPHVASRTFHPTFFRSSHSSSYTKHIHTYTASSSPAPTMPAQNGAPTPNGPSTAPPPQSSAWSTPGPAAFDFRSDVVTTPTASMLAAIQTCTLRDDVFLEDPTTTELERFVAELTGHDAALLVLSGTMGNQVALRTHLQGPPHGVLCDHRCHVNLWEAGGTASLSGAMVKTVVPAPDNGSGGKHLTLEDVEREAIVDDDVHLCPTRVISLENTLNGTVLPLAEVRRISKWARAQSPRVALHLDGARLWEAVAAGAGELKDYCWEFDSVSLCFSKGLGAPIGSIIVGSEKFIKRARWVRKSIGGGLRQAGVVSAAARVSVEETFLGGKLKQSHENAKRIAGVWEALGGKMAYAVETNMVWLDLAAAGVETDAFIRLAEEEGLRANGGRLVVHYQIGEEAIAGLEKVFRGILRKRKRDVEGDVEIPAKDMKVTVE